MKPLKYNIYFKVAIIIFIGLLLLIPAQMIRSLVYEREARQRDAISEVSSKWGQQQTLSGPFITIPFIKYMKETDKKNGIEKVIQVRDFIHILPSELKINGNMRPERRNRGIYDIVVYNSKINLSGKFPRIDLKEFDVPVSNIQFDKAHLTMGITDLRGIEEQVKLNWNAEKYLFNPGVISTDIIGSGINSPVGINGKDSSSYSFSFDLDIKGSQFLYFTPVGKITDVNISSSWKNPSFTGAFLPDSRNVSDTGFTAYWNILHLNRNYPQSWTGNKYMTGESVFGIDLLLPVDNYQKTTRAIKYAILFICFTFLVFFFIEVLNKVFIHPVQYILVGIALIVFFTLLLSVSEHLPFNLAYILSAIATLMLIALYIKAILKNTKLTILISSILFLLYTFIFIIIQLQDYALLIGSIGIFLILALVMYYSRKIDWYNLNMREEEE
ncbi:MAG: cell envelope integrity protein CreD [Saprospiraceae bacterium]|nr:cell envelope integrity protein CreD [Saprospiraceae bacterium]